MSAFDHFELPVDDLNAESPSSPVAILVIGMAGAGKTTFMHRVNLHMQEAGLRGYYINLDPAVQDVPFAANIDIRDTIDYKEVMKQYNLGPNGAILTSLNLFATRFDQVISLLERRLPSLDYIFIDTPGQIEAFTYSAGGGMMCSLLGSTLPCVVCYVLDTPRCVSPTTFMSNMVYASSVLYKTQLPMCMVFNKIDTQPCTEQLEWMRDFEKYQDALDAHSNNTNGGDYMQSLNRSLSLAMDEFYRNIRAVGVSSMTGDGMHELFVKLQESKQEYIDVFLPDLLSRMQHKTAEEKRREQESLLRLHQDLQTTKGDKLVVDAQQASK